MGGALTAPGQSEGACPAPLAVGGLGSTDVPPIMIFVPISLIVVYGCEIQECGPLKEKGGFKKVRGG